MHPRTTELLTHIETHRAALERTVADVPAALRDRRPTPDRWSVAEVLEHLSIVESQIAGLIQKQAEALRAAGDSVEPDTSSVLPMLDVDRLLDRSGKLVSGERSRPQGQLSADAAMQALSVSREKLRNAIIAADGLPLSKASAPHPYFGPYNLYQWVLFVGGHESRHAAQIREIAAALQAAP